MTQPDLKNPVYVNGEHVVIETNGGHEVWWKKPDRAARRGIIGFIGQEKSRTMAIKICNEFAGHERGDPVWVYFDTSK